MFDIVFSVKDELHQGQVLKVVGSLPELGSWDPQLAQGLVLKKGVWEGAKIRVQQNMKFEFKLIKVAEEGVVEWEQLPNNSNRKFKPKCSSKLQLTWSSPEGKISALTRASIKINGFPGAMMVSKTSKSSKHSKKSNQAFDPYQRAHDEQSDSSQQQEFLFMKRKLSDEITVNSLDLQQIYYNSSAMQIYWDLFKKLKLYVISKDVEINNPFMEYVEQQLKELPPTCLVKWITADCLVSKQNHVNSRKAKKRDSIYEIEEEELHIQSLYSRTSYFMFLEIETALKFKGKTGNVPTCLFLPSSKYQEALQMLPLMSHLHLICFDQPSINKAYCEYLQGNQGSSSGGECQNSNRLHITNPSILQIIEALKELKYRDTIILNTLGNIVEPQALKLIQTSNSITILDAHLAENYPSFTRKIVEKLDHYSLLIIVSQGDPQEEILEYRLHKNVVIVYSNYEKIILEGKEYHPLRKCQETFEFLKMKVKLYQQSHGGEVSEKSGSLHYNLPQDKLEIALRIQQEFKMLTSMYNFIRISLKGTRIKVNWSLAIQARIMRTISEIKYTNFGCLGGFNIISDRLSLRELKEALRLLIERCPKLFQAEHQTKVRYFSYGEGQAATCHILPEPELDQNPS